MMRSLILAALLAASGFSYEVKDVEVEFKAFKTPLKKGVGGEFDTVKVNTKKASSLKEMLLKTSVVIDTASIDSGNKARDAKLVASFFNVQGNETITAKIKEVKKEILIVAITLNGKTLDVPMKYEKENDEIEAEGVIDLADFGMLPSLEAINKACFDLHQGKTWQDIEIEFKLKYKD